jgi:chromosome segregation ATPase
MGLLEDFKKRQQEEDSKRPPVPDLPPVVVEKSPLQRISDAEMEIKAFQKEQELESVRSGFESFKIRESSLVGKETDLASREEKLRTQIGAFELEQKTRVEKANKIAEDYNKAYELLKTERKEATRIMTEAIEKKSEAESIIKSQTETEKTNQEKQEAYVSNMDDSMKLLNQVYGVLRKQDDGKLLTLAGVLYKDLTLISWLQFKKCALQTIADIISVDIDRITEVCEYLQNTKKDYNQVLKYLLDSTEWLQTKLKIEWQPNPIVLP